MGIDIGAVTVTPASLSRTFEGMVSVASLNRAGELSDFSNFGFYVEIGAPGESILSTSLQDSYSIKNGTSFAAPMVTGAVAVMIGQLKRMGVAYNPAYLESLLRTSGRDRTVAVSSRAGGVLDLAKLVTAIKSLSNLSAVPRAVTIGTPSWNVDEGTLFLFVTWDLPVLPEGAQVIVFDDNQCGFLKGCEVDFHRLDSLTGGHLFRINRNAVAPLQPGQFDPEYPLRLSAAVVTTVPGKNAYTVLGSASMNLRDIDKSTATSQIQGQVENIRMDQQFLYVNGWVCLEQSNKAAKVELVNLSSGQVINTSGGYHYPYMEFHSSPIDHEAYDSGVDNVLFVPDIKTNFKNFASHNAGGEGSLDVIVKCRTLTAAHGFEFIVPHPVVNSLRGVSFQVRASLAGRVKVLTDISGDSTFSFPEITVPSAVSGTFSITRGDLVQTMSGTLCSPSPSPVSSELFFSIENFDEVMFPDGRAGSGSGLGGYVNNPAVAARQVDEYSTSVTVANGVASFVGDVKAKTFVNLDDLPWSVADGVVTKSLGRFFDEQARKPNSFVLCPLGESNGRPFTSHEFANAMNARMFFVAPSTGQSVRLFCSIDERGSLGSQRRIDIDDSAAASASRGVDISDFHLMWWDYYDAGEAFSDRTVRYSLAPLSGVGVYLKNTYSVGSLLREIKKFETPLHYGAIQLAVKSVERAPERCSDNRYKFNYTATVDLNGYAPGLTERVMGFFPNRPASISLNVAEALRRVPISIRFYQDARMVLHSQSNTASEFTSLRYPFHEDGYQ
jgi:hypothetical protein